MKRTPCTLVLLFSILLCFSQQKEYKIKTIAFYNLENLFDTINNPNKKDEYSPILQMKSGKENAYLQKIENMAKVISEIGKRKTGKSPSIIGICEIENSNVIDDLLNSKYLKSEGYNYVHADSPDWRGIDVALIYKESDFSVSDYKTYGLKAWNSEGYRIKTRSQLLVSGYLDDELIHIIVNHWPSQRGGAKKSEYLRVKSAELNLKIIEDIYFEEPNAKIITLGDFNDNPEAKSIRKTLRSKGKKKKLKEGELYNPFVSMYKRGFGSLGFRDNMNLFDQVLLTPNFLSKSSLDYSAYRFYKANIYNPNYLTTRKGRYKGYPFRSWSNGKFTGGYSDHYPVYVYLIKDK
ncbi:MAG: endonuclease/exonuclease/phosphatase family protein [Flavobacteriaceae bacterium]|nr:endonuclease/exonuclease/phosphatase family protein [Flavobacteriaceae bacterium]